MGCSACTLLPHLASIARQDRICTACGTVYLYRPAWVAPPPDAPPTPRRLRDPERALARLLSDLAEVARGRLHACPGSCLLGHLVGEAYAPRHDQLPQASPAAWTLDDSMALGHASLAAVADDYAPEHDWTRWRRLEGKLSSFGGLRGRVLRWLLEHARAKAVAEDFVHQLAIDIARPERRARWLEAYPPPGEHARRRKGRPRRQAGGRPFRWSPTVAGEALLRGALEAWDRDA